MSAEQQAFYEQLLAVHTGLLGVKKTLLLIQWLNVVGLFCFATLVLCYCYPDHVSQVYCMLRAGWVRLGALLGHRTVEYRSTMAPGECRRYSYYKLHLILGCIPIWFWRASP